MKIKYLLILGLLCLHPCILKAQPDPLLFNQEDNATIAVNNRILAKINGKPITVVDVMKKMDMVFYRQFPEYASSKIAHYQFYQVNWMHILKELIDKELVLADAEEVKLPVSNGDVRQEMEELFGPNIIANLDKAGLSYDEAFKMIQGDIIIRRMMMIRVNAKALKKISPQEIRIAYEKHAKENIRADEWSYQVVSIRDPDETKGAAAANMLHHLLVEDRDSIEDAAKKVKSSSSIEKTTSINISEIFKHTDKEVSPAYKEILTTMTAGAYSQPKAQKSRSDKSTVFRIFYLTDKKAGGIIPYHELENGLKEKLIQEEIVKETEKYFKRLHQHFAINETQLKELVPDDFQPFVLKQIK